MQFNFFKKIFFGFGLFFSQICNSQILSQNWNAQSFSFSAPTQQKITLDSINNSNSDYINILNVYKKPLFAILPSELDKTGTYLLHQIYDQIIYVEPDARKMIFAFLEGAYLNYDDTTFIFASSLACYGYGKQLEMHFTKQLANDVIKKIKLLQEEENKIQELIAECLDKAYLLYQKAVRIHSSKNALGALRTWMAAIVCVLYKTSCKGYLGAFFTMYEFANYLKNKDGDGVLFIQ